MNEISYCAAVEKLPFEIIQDFRKTGKSLAIPKEVQQYIIEVDAVIQIKQLQRFDNVSRLARTLMTRFPNLAFRTAKERIYDAYNLFHVNDSVAEDVWDTLYADKMEDLAELCIARGKEEEARRALKDAHEMRTKSKNKLKAEDFKGNVYIVSIDVKPEDLGFERGNLKEIARREIDGHYRKLINSLNNISDADKSRLYIDAGITEAEIIEEDEP
jgi:hypothetical protein